MVKQSSIESRICLPGDAPSCLPLVIIIKELSAFFPKELFLSKCKLSFFSGKSYGTEVDWMDSTSEEVALWEKMVKSPNTWIEATLPLRMLLIAKISK